MDTNYFIRIRGQIKGPYDPETLLAMSKRSQFARHNEVSIDGETWFSASEFPELFPERSERHSVKKIKKKRPASDQRITDEPIAIVAPNADTTQSNDNTSKSEPEEDARWFYGVDEEKVGGVTLSEIRSLFKHGVLSKETFVWNPDIEWTRIGDVAELSRPVANEEVVNEGEFIVLDEGITTKTRLKRDGPRSNTNQVVLLLSALLMVISMFVPWWSIYVSTDKDENKGKWGKYVSNELVLDNKFIDARLKIIRKLNPSSSEGNKDKRNTANVYKIIRAHKKWWKTHLKGGEVTFDENLTVIAEEVDDDEASYLLVRLWGWSEGIAIMGLVFGLIILAAVIFFLCLSRIRKWNWIVSMIACIFGVIVTIFSAVWIFTAPGADADGLVQGIIAGPYILLISGILFCVFGLLDGIFGVKEFNRSRRIASASLAISD